MIFMKLSDFEGRVLLVDTVSIDAVLPSNTLFNGKALTTILLKNSGVSIDVMESVDDIAKKLLEVDKLNE